MRLFHVSEEGNIDIFNPRIPEREDLDKSVGLVWAALLKRNVELRIIKNLWDISDKIKTTTLNWSICRMGYAQPRLYKNKRNQENL